jgi:hypothetical protein
VAKGERHHQQQSLVEEHLAVSLNSSTFCPSTRRHLHLRNAVYLHLDIVDIVYFFQQSFPYVMVQKDVREDFIVLYQKHL